MSDVIRGSYDVPTVQRTHPEISICDSTQGVQCHGILLKQHKRRNRSARWNKRLVALFRRGCSDHKLQLLTVFYYFLLWNHFPLI